MYTQLNEEVRESLQVAMTLNGDGWTKYCDSSAKEIAEEEIHAPPQVEISR